MSYRPSVGAAHPLITGPLEKPGQPIQVLSPPVPGLVVRRGGRPENNDLILQGAVGESLVQEKVTIQIGDRSFTALVHFHETAMQVGQDLVGQLKAANLPAVLLPAGAGARLHVDATRSASCLTAGQLVALENTINAKLRADGGIGAFAALAGMKVPAPVHLAYRDAKGAARLLIFKFSDCIPGGTGQAAAFGVERSGASGGADDVLHLFDATGIPLATGTLAPDGKSFAFGAP